jgi:molybdopterin converting factor small subunit
MRVEFFGIPRLRAGVAAVDIELGTSPTSVQEVLRILAQKCPEFAEACLQDGWLKTGYTINIDGKQFAREPTASVRANDTLIVMSSDAGG